MLVDLARNDLSRSCNNVVVEKDRNSILFTCYPLISKVTGYLKSNLRKLLEILFQPEFNWSNQIQSNGINKSI